MAQFDAEGSSCDPYWRARRDVVVGYGSDDHSSGSASVIDDLEERHPEAWFDIDDDRVEFGRLGRCDVHLLSDFDAVNHADEDPGLGHSGCDWCDSGVDADGWLASG